MAEARRARRVEEVLRAADVHALEVRAPERHGEPGRVDDRVHSVDGAAQRRAVVDGAGHGLDPEGPDDGEVARRAHQRADRVPGRREPLTDVAPEESRGAGDQDLQSDFSYTR